MSRSILDRAMRLAAILSLALAAGHAEAAETPLAMDAAFRLSVSRVDVGHIQLTWHMPSGYYLYRQHLAAKMADGSAIALTTTPGVKKDDPSFGTSEVHYGTAKAEFQDTGSAVTVTYQGCQEHGLCYPPAHRTIDPQTLAVSEQAGFSPPAASQSAWSKGVAATDGDIPAIAETARRGNDNIVDGVLAQGGIPLALLAFFGFGILLAFTPCVFPLYPILAATLARQGDQLTARRGFVLSASYAVALASAFALFGAGAAWTGENLQIALQSRLTAVAIALVFALLALSMFGLFELQLPSAWVKALSKAGQGRRSSVGSAMTLGFSSAFVIGPCVTAPLAGALLYVTRTGDVVVGAALLFALGLGKGVPLVVFGTVGSKALPRAGAWMTSVKHVFGLVFLALAIWMAGPMITGAVVLGLWAVWAMAVAVFLRAFEVPRATLTPLRIGQQALGLVAGVYAVLLVVGLAAGSSDPIRPLDGFSREVVVAGPAPEERMTEVMSRSDLAAQLDAAEVSGKPSLIYFTADWCVSCRSIARVLSEPNVAGALSSFNALKVDLTNIAPGQREMMRALDVVGPPTIVFFAAGQKLGGERLVGEFTADDFLKAAAATGTPAKPRT